MIDQKKVLAVILARGGSKGLPRKNVLDCAGKPLIAWTIEAGEAARYVDRLILSSDDDEIMRVAEDYGCEVPFQRPRDLAEDESTSMDALLHALEQLPEYDYVVLLQPTSPLRIAEDIDACIEKMHKKKAPTCVSVTKTDKPPEWMYTKESGDRLAPILPKNDQVTRRQEATPTYVLNGAVYVADIAWLYEHTSFLHEETVAYVMPPNRSEDVDTRLDLEWLRFVINTSPFTS
jgi:N-acylneuraminate cytidylyltransferase